MSLKCQPLPWNLLLKSSKKFRQGKFSVPLALCQLYNDSVGFSLFPNLDPLWTKWRFLNSPQWISNPLPTFKDYRFFWFWWVPRGDKVPENIMVLFLFSFWCGLFFRNCILFLLHDCTRYKYLPFLSKKLLCFWLHIKWKGRFLQTHVFGFLITEIFLISVLCLCSLLP